MGKGNEREINTPRAVFPANFDFDEHERQVAECLAKYRAAHPDHKARLKRRSGSSALRSFKGNIASLIK